MSKTDVMAVWWSAAMCLNGFDWVYIRWGIKTNGASYHAHRWWHIWVAGQRSVRSASSQGRPGTVCVEFHMLAPWLHKAVPWLHKPARDQRLWTFHMHSPIPAHSPSVLFFFYIFFFCHSHLFFSIFSVHHISRCERTAYIHVTLWTTLFLILKQNRKCGES